MNAKDPSAESLMEDKLQLFKIYNHPDYFDEEKIRNQLKLSFKRAHYPAGLKRTLLALLYDQVRTDKLKKLNVPCLIRK